MDSSFFTDQSESTLLNMNDKKSMLRGKFLRQIEMIKSKSTIDESIFNALLKGLKIFIKIMKHSYDVIKDIIIQWMDTILEIKHKTIEKSAKQLFENNLSQFTQLFASIMVHPSAESSFKVQFFSVWSKIISNTNPIVRRNIATSNVETMAWMCESILTADHFLTQTCALELFFKYLSTCEHKEKEAILKEFIMDNLEELYKMLLTFNVRNFITESRKFLNEFNNKMSDGAVHSITVEAGFIESFPIIKPKVEKDLDFWLDFNNRNGSVSFFCDVTTFSETQKFSTVNVEIFFDNITLNKTNNIFEVHSDKNEIFPSGSYEILKSNNKFRFIYYIKDLPFLSSFIASYQSQTEENDKCEDAFAQNGREFDKETTTNSNLHKSRNEENKTAKEMESAEESTQVNGNEKNNNLENIPINDEILSKSSKSQNSNSQRNKKKLKRDQKNKTRKCDNYAKDDENVNPDNLNKSQNQEKSVDKINQIITDPLLDTEVNAADVQDTLNRTFEKSEHEINGINKEIPEMFAESLEITKKNLHTPPKNYSTFNKNLMNENSLHARSSVIKLSNRDDENHFAENESEILRSASPCRDSKQRKRLQLGNQPFSHKVNCIGCQEDVMIKAKIPIPKIFNAQQTQRRQYIRKGRQPLQKAKTTMKLKNLTKPLTDKSENINKTISKSTTNKPSISGNYEEIQNCMEEYVNNGGYIGLKNALRDKNFSKQLNIHEQEVLNNNVEKINTILEGTTKKFFKSRTSYQQNQTEDIYDMKNIGSDEKRRKKKDEKVSNSKKHIVPKFIGESKSATFSYRRNENSKSNFPVKDVNQNVSQNTNGKRKTKPKVNIRNKNNLNKKKTVQNKKVTLEKPEQVPEISQHVVTAIVHRKTSPEPIQVENREEIIENAQFSHVQLRRDDFDALHLSNSDISYQSITMRRAHHTTQFQNNDDINESWTIFGHQNFNEITKTPNICDKYDGPSEVTVKENTELISANPKELDSDASSCISECSVENLLQDDNLDLDSYLDEDCDSLMDANLKNNDSSDKEKRKSIGSDDIRNISQATYTVGEAFCIVKRRTFEKSAEIDVPRKKRKINLDILPNTQLTSDVQMGVSDVFQKFIEQLQNENSFDETLKLAIYTIKEYFKSYTKHFEGVQKSLNKIEEIRKEFEKEQQKLLTESNYGCKHLLKLTSGLDKLKKTLNDQKNKGAQNIQSKFKTEADLVLRQHWESYLNEFMAILAGNIENLSNLNI